MLPIPQNIVPYSYTPSVLHASLALIMGKAGTTIALKLAHICYSTTTSFTITIQ